MLTLAVYILDERRKRMDHFTREERTVPERDDAEVTRALLNARWELVDARVLREARERGTLPEGDLSEEEIARTAVEMASAGR